MIDASQVHFEEQRTLVLIALVIGQRTGKINRTEVAKTLACMKMDWENYNLMLETMPCEHGLVGVFPPKEGDNKVRWLDSLADSEFASQLWSYDRNTGTFEVNIELLNARIVEARAQEESYDVSAAPDAFRIIVKEMDDEEITFATSYGEVLANLNADQLTALATARNCDTVVPCIEYELRKLSRDLRGVCTELRKLLKQDRTRILQNIRTKLKTLADESGKHRREYHYKIGMYTGHGVVKCGGKEYENPRSSIYAATRKIKDTETESLERAISAALKNTVSEGNPRDSEDLISLFSYYKSKAEIVSCVQYTTRNLLPRINIDGNILVNLDTGEHEPLESVNRLKSLLPRHVRYFGKLDTGAFSKTYFDISDVKNLLPTLNRLVECLPIPRAESPADESPLISFLRSYNLDGNLSNIEDNTFVTVTKAILDNLGLVVELAQVDMIQGVSPEDTQLLELLSNAVDLRIKPTWWISPLTQYASKGVLLRWLRTPPQNNHISGLLVEKFADTIDREGLNQGILIHLGERWEREKTIIQTKCESGVHIRRHDFVDLARMIDQMGYTAWSDFLPIGIYEHTIGVRFDVFTTLVFQVMDKLSMITGSMRDITDNYKHLKEAIRESEAIGEISKRKQEGILKKRLTIDKRFIHHVLIDTVDKFIETTGFMGPIKSRWRALKALKVLDNLVSALQMPKIDNTILSRFLRGLELIWNPTRALQVRIVKVSQHILLNKVQYRQEPKSLVRIAQEILKGLDREILRLRNPFIAIFFGALATIASIYALSLLIAVTPWEALNRIDALIGVWVFFSGVFIALMRGRSKARHKLNG